MSDARPLSLSNMQFTRSMEHDIAEVVCSSWDKTPLELGARYVTNRQSPGSYRRSAKLLSLFQPEVYMILNHSLHRTRSPPWTRKTRTASIEGPKLASLHVDASRPRQRPLLELLSACRSPNFQAQVQHPEIPISIERRTVEVVNHVLDTGAAERRLCSEEGVP